MIFHVHIKTVLEIYITRRQYLIKHDIIDSVLCCFNTHYCIHFCNELLPFVLIVSRIYLIDLHVGLECNAYILEDVRFQYTSVPSFLWRFSYLPILDIASYCSRMDTIMQNSIFIAQERSKYLGFFYLIRT